MKTYVVDTQRNYYIFFRSTFPFDAMDTGGPYYAINIYDGATGNLLLQNGEAEFYDEGSRTMRFMLPLLNFSFDQWLIIELVNIHADRLFYSKVKYGAPNDALYMFLGEEETLVDEFSGELRRVEGSGAELYELGFSRLAETRLYTAPLPEGLEGRYLAIAQEAAADMFLPLVSGGSSFNTVFVSDVTCDVVLVNEIEATLTVVDEGLNNL